LRAERIAEEIDLPATSVLTRTGRNVVHTGPMDIVTWLRSKQGIRDSGGELRSRDLTDRTIGRQGIEFVGREAQYGPLVDNERGMALDDATLRAWEAGYFPGMTERPTPDDLLRAIDETVSAGRDLSMRRFPESDSGVIDRLLRRADDSDTDPDLLIDQSAAGGDDMAAESQMSDGVQAPVRRGGAGALRPEDDPAEIFARGSDPDFDPSPGTDPDIESIPFYAEAEAALAARSKPGSEWDGVSHETLADPELLEIEEMRKAGELSPADEAEMSAADALTEQAESYAVGYETLAGCVVRHGA
jgi:hypothetical protein